MTHENSPLLPPNKNTHRVEYGLPTKTETSSYDRFTPARKRMIVALVSLSGMIPCMPIIPVLTQTVLADWLILSGTLDSVCYRFFRPMHTADISRSTNDRDRRQASHVQFLLRAALNII